MYFCREIRRKLGTKRNPRGLLTHELGHHVLRHCSESAVMEMEADALAVKVLEV
jgi:hypothetical protein